MGADLSSSDWDDLFDFRWEELEGMGEEEAEAHMRAHWGKIPDLWNSPIARDIITGRQGQAELDGHMNWGDQTYGHAGNPTEVAGTWYRRNIEGQGHPAVQSGDWKPKVE